MSKLLEISMKLLLSSLLLSLSVLSAQTESMTIHSIIQPEAGDKDYLVLTNNGLVYGINIEDSELVGEAYKALEANSEIKISYSESFVKSLQDKRLMVKDIERTIDLNTESTDTVYSDITPLNNYTVTNLKSYDDAKKLFREMRTDTRNNSQCYNRAHVWAYEFSQRRNLNAGKVWIYFTSKYIREYDYKWWFHVAPYFEVVSESEKIVMDRKFSRNPQRLTDWKNDYMKNKANCPEITKYSGYDDNRWSNYCYLLFSSKYYWQPHNFKSLEATGEEKRSYISSELRAAYKNGIRRRNRPQI